MVLVVCYRCVYFLKPGCPLSCLLLFTRADIVYYSRSTFHWHCLLRGQEEMVFITVLPIYWGVVTHSLYSDSKLLRCHKLRLCCLEYKLLFGFMNSMLQYFVFCLLKYQTKYLTMGSLFPPPPPLPTLSQGMCRCEPLWHLLFCK